MLLTPTSPADFTAHTRAQDDVMKTIKAVMAMSSMTSTSTVQKTILLTFGVVMVTSYRAARLRKFVLLSL